MTDDRITQEELFKLFPAGITPEVYALVFEAPDGTTIAEIRASIRALAITLDARKPREMPTSIWELCRSAWLEETDKRPSELDDADYKAITFAAWRLFYNQGRVWE